MARLYPAARQGRALSQSLVGSVSTCKQHRSSPSPESLTGQARPAAKEAASLAAEHLPAPKTLQAVRDGSHLRPVLVGPVHASDKVYGPLARCCREAVHLVDHVEVEVALAALDAAPVVELLSGAPGVGAEGRPGHPAIWPLQGVTVGADQQGLQQHR